MTEIEIPYYIWLMDRDKIDGYEQAYSFHKKN